MAMEPDFGFWMIAWTMMGLAFMSAFLAILLGAHGLDQVSRNNKSDLNTDMSDLEI